VPATPTDVVCAWFQFLEKWYDMTDVTFDDDEAKAGRLAALNREEVRLGENCGVYGWRGEC